MKQFLVFIAFACLILLAYTSSHSEAPGTAQHPKSDITDLYMFKCYEPGREDFTCFIINTQPLEQAYAGPNYYAMSDKHFYELYIDNDGDGSEDHTFQFFFGNRLGGAETLVSFEADDDDCNAIGRQTRDLGPTDLMVRKHSGVALDIGTPGNTRSVPIALKVFGSVSASNRDGALNFFEWYHINHIAGDRTFGTRTPITNVNPQNNINGNDNTEFDKPFDYSGPKSFADYESYSRTFIHEFDMPGCSVNGRVFVGQREEPFYITLGPIFDLINFIPIPGLPGLSVAENKSNNSLQDSNITSLVLEIPTECLLDDNSDNDVLGAWAGVRTLHHDGDEHVPGKQVSRLGMPLVNELFVGLNDKKVFTQSEPRQDVDYLTLFLEYPTFPAIVDILFLDAVNSVLSLNPPAATLAPTNFPRDDLYNLFMRGIPTINSPDGVVDSEMMRLNTTIAATSRANQSPFGVLGGDLAGYPNGRRPGDDSVDISLRAAMGALCHANLFCAPADAPFGTVEFTDGSPIDATDFQNQFPYLNTPNTYNGAIATSA